MNTEICDWDEKGRAGERTGSELSIARARTGGVVQKRIGRGQKEHLDQKTKTWEGCMGGEGEVMGGGTEG